MKNTIYIWKDVLLKFYFILGFVSDNYGILGGIGIPIGQYNAYNISQTGSVNKFVCGNNKLFNISFNSENGITTEIICQHLCYAKFSCVKIICSIVFYMKINRPVRMFKACLEYTGIRFQLKVSYSHFNPICIVLV